MIEFIEDQTETVHVTLHTDNIKYIIVVITTDIILYFHS